MAKRITICIDVSDENIDKAQGVVNDLYLRTLHSPYGIGADPNFNWDVSIDEVKPTDEEVN